MAGQHVESRVKELLEPLANSQNATIEDVDLSNTSMGQILAITVDKDDSLEHLNSEQVANLARAFSKELDKHDPIEGRYTLEVGSPGAEKELTNDRQYRRAIGQKVRVLLRNSHKVEGTLTAVTDDGFTLQTKDGDREIPFDSVHKAHPVVEAPED